MVEKKILITAVFFGFFAIIFGAFGAHGLKKVLTSEQLLSFETGVKYQMYHALFLLAVANFSFLTLKEKQIIFYLTFFGVLFFSFSIYLLSLQNILKLNLKFLGPVTPFGGLLLILSWGYLFYTILIKKFS